MDLDKIIRTLRERLAEIEKEMAAIEPLVRPEIAQRRRRGRKSMGPAERAQVSERMKKYWAARRKSNQH